MIIIVEGVDRVGKTTLCKRVCKELNIKMFHDGYKAPYIKNSSKVLLVDEEVNQIIDMKFEQMLQWLKVCGSVVIDRCHLTEYAYDFNRGLYFKNIRAFDEKLAKLDTHLVLVESENIEKSSKEHGADLRVTEAVMKSLFYGSSIKNKYKTKWSDFDSVVHALVMKYAVNAAEQALKDVIG